MTRYTREELNREAADAVRDVRRETRKPAKLWSWELILNEYGGATLAVIIRAYDGMRQRNVAI